MRMKKQMNPLSLHSQSNECQIEGIIVLYYYFYCITKAFSFVAFCDFCLARYSAHRTTTIEFCRVRERDFKIKVKRVRESEFNNQLK